MLACEASSSKKSSDLSEKTISSIYYSSILHIASIYLYNFVPLAYLFYFQAYSSNKESRPCPPRWFHPKVKYQVFAIHYPARNRW